LKNKHDFFNKKKRYSHKVLLRSILLVVLFSVGFVLFCPTLTRGQSTNTASTQSNQIQSRLQSQLQGIQFENGTVYVGIWVLHIYSFQYTSGTYTFDMYVFFFWADPSVTSANWYLTNGYPINDAAKVLVASDITGRIKYEIYRVTATLNTPPDARDYPFDQINFRVSLELINVGNPVSLTWLQNATGVDPAFVNPNWKTTNIAVSTSEHSYPLGVQAPLAEMTITQTKLKPSAALASLFPPLVFCFVSVISFLFSLKDPGSVGLRMGLNTSMLITTILFQLNISSSIPPSTSVSIFGLFSICVLVFLSLNLVVTIFGFAHFVKFKNADFTLKVNRWGFVLTIILPVVLFILLYFLRA
jgi:hypothetical protein